jgi:hypothetical protein
LNERARERQIDSDKARERLSCDGVRELETKRDLDLEETAEIDVGGDSQRKSQAAWRVAQKQRWHEGGGLEAAAAAWRLSERAERLRGIWGFRVFIFKVREI